MARISQSNSKRSAQSKKVSHSIPENHIEAIRFFEAKMNEKEALNLSNTYIDWIDINQNATYLTQYLAETKILQKSWYEWGEKYECLKKANEYGKTVFAARREAVAQAQREPAPDPFAEEWRAISSRHLSETHEE